jgi:hypothetical protein
MNRANESLSHTPTLAAGPGGVHVMLSARSQDRRRGVWATHRLVAPFLS